MSFAQVDEVKLRKKKYNNREPNKHKTRFLSDIIDNSECLYQQVKAEIDDSDIQTVPDDIDAKCDHVFVKFAESTDLEEVLALFAQVKSVLSPHNTNPDVQDSTFLQLFPRLLKDLPPVLPHRYSELLRHLNNAAQNKEYRGNTAANGVNVLIIGESFT